MVVRADGKSGWLSVFEFQGGVGSRKVTLRKGGWTLSRVYVTFLIQFFIPACIKFEIYLYLWGGNLIESWILQNKAFTHHVFFLFLFQRQGSRLRRLLIDQVIFFFLIFRLNLIKDVINKYIYYILDSIKTTNWHSFLFENASSPLIHVGKATII